MCFRFYDWLTFCYSSLFLAYRFTGSCVKSMEMLRRPAMQRIWQSKLFKLMDIWGTTRALDERQQTGHSVAPESIFRSTRTIFDSIYFPLQVIQPKQIGFSLCKSAPVVLQLDSFGLKIQTCHVLKIEPELTIQIFPKPTPHSDKSIKKKATPDDVHRIGCCTLMQFWYFYFVHLPIAHEHTPIKPDCHCNDPIPLSK